MSRGITPRAQGVHPSTLALFARQEDPIRVGTQFDVAFDLSCPHGCEEEPVALTLQEPGGASRIMKAPLANHPAQFELTAPTEAGAHTWQFDVAPSGHDGLFHEASSMSLTVDVVPHAASVAVWALPDAVISGRPFNIKVGATSTAGRAIAGQTIIIHDIDGEEVGRTTLGDTAWPDTVGLLWAEVELRAPDQPGVATFAASLVVERLKLPHETTACTFTVPVTAAPEHCVTVTVVDATTGAPLPDTLVRIGAYRSTTGDNGMATLHVPKGSAEIVVWKTGYDAPDSPIEIVADKAIKISATAVPEDDPDAHWKG